MRKHNNYFDCRYGEFVKALFGDNKVIWDKSENDYSGKIEVLFESTYDEGLNTEQTFVHFDYGSCSGCDCWESAKLSDDQIKLEIAKLSLTMTKSQMTEWLSKAKFDD